MNEELYRRITALEQWQEGFKFPEFPLGLALISEQILTSTAASVTFSGVVQTYRHLLLICQARTDRSAESDGLLLRFNADSGANYDRQGFAANNTTLTGGVNRAATSIQVGSVEAANARASNFSPVEIKIFGYARTDAEKPLFSQSVYFGDVSADTDLLMLWGGSRWRNTAAITSITLLPTVGPNFVSGSHFQLYGIK